MLWVALVLGLVEGLTEFLPISSTGHLILVAGPLGLTGRRAEVFEIFIQLGAVLAVVWEYRARLLDVAKEARHSADARAFVLRLGVAFVPAAAAALLLHEWISEHLFGPRTVALALIAGAVLIFVVEAAPLRVRTEVAERTGWAQAVGIGLAQCLSLWPGFSRSGATILGGMCCGLSRRAATEFSFLLAIPTLGAATVYDLGKNASHLEPGDLQWLGLALVVSFVVAWATIRWLLRWVSTHTLRPFAWYRIALGLIVLVAL
jgi:undecaprenyl-diphosphatase